MPQKTATIHKGSNDEWFITLRNRRNGNIVADGAEGYHNRSNALRALRATFGDGYHLVPYPNDPNKFYMTPRALGETGA